MLKDNGVTGVIVIYRKEGTAVHRKQIESSTRISPPRRSSLSL